MAWQSQSQLTLGLFTIGLAFFALFTLLSVTVLTVFARAFLTFAVVVALGLTFAVVIAVSDITVSLALAILGAAGAVTAVVVALTAVFLARRVVATTGTGCRAGGAATRRTVTTVATITAITTVATVSTLTARRTTGIEAPRSRGRGSGPLSGGVSLLSWLGSVLGRRVPRSSIPRCG